MKNKKGISLIVLVITIIVLAILAATVIVTITNSGIINKATDTVKIHDLSQVRSLASLAWSEALMDETITTDAEYDAYVKQQLTNAGVNVSDYDISASINGIEVNKKSDIVWEANVTAATPNVIFTKADGVTPGDPENLEDGDIVLYGDYEYRYMMDQSMGDGEWSEMPFGYFSDPLGWGVALREESKTKTSVGSICNSLFGESVVSLSGAFVDANIVKAPAIPESVVFMRDTFANCAKLETSPEVPSIVEDMSYTYCGCVSLKSAPVLPENLRYMDRNIL